jgi:hypothetical protein
MFVFPEPPTAEDEEGDASTDPGNGDDDNGDDFNAIGGGQSRTRRSDSEDQEETQDALRSDDDGDGMQANTFDSPM